MTGNKQLVRDAIQKAWFTGNPKTFGEALDFAADEVTAAIIEKLEGLKEDSHVTSTPSGNVREPGIEIEAHNNAIDEAIKIIKGEE